MRIVAAILSAGKGSRFGSDKTQALLGSKPVWRWSYDTFEAHPKVDEVIIIVSEENEDNIRQALPNVRLAHGGPSRQTSSLAALQLCDSDVLLLHDAARPFISPEVIDRVIEGILENGAAGASVPVVDTIKQIKGEQVTTLDRRQLVAMQTPQGATTSILWTAHNQANREHTDDMALIEALGHSPMLVEGEPKNFKITTREDMLRAKAMIGQTEYRTGMGYDVHPFSTDPNRTLYLGGVAFEGHPALDGHSDADALLHAVVDALLGAAALGDIGQHFPNTDSRWKGEPSITFLIHAKKLLIDAGWSIVNLDMTVIAETPKVMKQATAICETIAINLQISPERVNLKATTNEKMGFIGRKEGIAALATATIARCLLE